MGRKLAKLFLLTKGEIYKILKSKSIIISISIIIMMIIISGITAFTEKSNSGDWKLSLQEKVEEDLALIQEVEELDDPTNATYIEEIELNVLKNQYALENNINEEFSSTGFIKRNINITFIITIILMILASKIVSKEVELGTIKFLLIRPYTRWKIVLSKYITLISLAVFLYITLILLSSIAGLIIYGVNSFETQTLLINNGVIEKESMLIYIFKLYLYSFIPTLAYTSLALMLSILLKSSGVAISLSIISATMMGMIAAYFEKFKFSKYILFNNLNLSKYLNGEIHFYPSLDELFSISIILIYSVLFMIFTCWIFKRRDFA